MTMLMRVRLAPIAIAVAAVTVALGLAACGSSGGSSSNSDPAKPQFLGSVASPQLPAPQLALDNSLGQPVNLDNYRGKAVLVTFIYDHCPDICPLIVSHLHTAQAELGAQSKKLQIIAVSVDPKGDTPKTVKAFLAEHRMTGRMQYLIGSRPQLEKTWRAWHIKAASRPTKNNPDAVEHSALIYGINGAGKVTTLYPANFAPKMIVHDVPLLAAQTS
jgi:protein SCO1/2